MPILYGLLSHQTVGIIIIIIISIIIIIIIIIITTTIVIFYRVYRVLVGKLRESVHLEDPGLDGRIILRWVPRKWDLGAWIGLIWLRIGTDGGHL